MELFIYNLEDNSHVATITGDNNEACEAAAHDAGYVNDFGWTYSPAFAFDGGLTLDHDAEIINAN
ncbi:MAG: hypothetical protein HQL67_10950 [Magnetococcales bacterium]|nr:hypothetical protein [Magnetococcales bacterium]